MRVAKQKAVAPSPKKAAHNNGVQTTQSNDERLLAKLRVIVSILEGSSLAEIEYEDADIAITLSRHGHARPSAAPALLEQPPPAAPAYPAIAVAAPPRNERPAQAVTPSAPAAEADDVHIIRSPFIGTFYRSSTPEAEAYAEVGKPVRRGQTLCIIEAMKLMNEIESEVDGVVLEVFSDNGKTVQYGDALFKIKKSS